VHLILCVSSVSGDSSRFHFAKEGSRAFGFDEALPGVFVSQSSPISSQEIQHPASSLLGPRCVVSLMRHFVSLIAVHEKPSFAILAIFNARSMSDCSIINRPPCLAIVADMLKT
jgi:hypothetical protein